jgi:long-chain fatty acid transport protein
MNTYRIGLSLTLLVATATPAFAGGVTLPGYGSQAQPRAGAFVAKADDPSAIFHNPAGLAKLKGTVIQIGFNLINYSLKFKRAGTYDNYTNDGNNLDFAGEEYDWVENSAHGASAIGDFTAVPLLAAATDLGLDLPMMFAAGVFAPGAGSPDREFAEDYDLEANPELPPPPGRYDILSQEAVIIFPSLAAAYRVSDKLQVGARVSWGFGTAKGRSSVWGLRNYEEWEGNDGVFELEASDSFIPAFGAGVMYRPLDSVEIGLNYRSAATAAMKGTGRNSAGSGTLIDGMDAVEPRTEPPYSCGAGGTVSSQIACMDLKLPQVAALGVRYIVPDGKGGERADIELDVQWEDYSAASDVVNKVDAKTPTLQKLPPGVIRHGFQDVWSIRLGGSYTVDMGDAGKVNLRAGYAHDTPAAPLSWTRLDQDGFAHDVAAAGVGYDLAGWRVEVSGGTVFEAKRVVDHGGCNPTVANPGCSGDGSDTPVRERNAPDPVQPLRGAGNQVESPFNAGQYIQSYLFFGFGLSRSF